MKKLLTLLLVLMTFHAKPCGWSPDSDDYFYYNIFHQTSISNQAFYPFLYDEMNLFFGESRWQDKITIDQGNVALWKKLLKDQSEEDINIILKTNNDSIFQELWKGPFAKANPKVKHYIEYARKCSNTFSKRDHYYSHSWDYEKIRYRENIDPSTLLLDGNDGFNGTTGQLKMRYAYQIIRTLHYSGRYKEAIGFFNKYLVNEEKNEIYYYILDQIAGCHFKTSNIEKAAHLFIRVFNKSIDRKKSAFLSYSFCTSSGHEGKSHFEEDDKAAYLLMRSLRSFSTGLEGLHELFKEAPNDDKVELLFMRSLNYAERQILPKHIGLTEGNRSLPLDAKLYDTKRLNALSAFASRAANHPKVENKAFWKMAQAYVLFLQGEFNQADKMLYTIQSDAYQTRLEALKNIMTVFSWQEMDEEKEIILAQKLQVAQPTDEFESNWKDFILERVGHLYYKSGKLGKSFLIHNSIEAIEGVPSLKVINSLLDFVGKPKKNEFEKLLMTRAHGDKKNTAAISYMKAVKGNYYMQQNEPKKAYEWLSKANLNLLFDFETTMTHKVSAKIFSNSLRECFDCNTDTLMEDLVYKAKDFGFIDTEITRTFLASYLVKLKEMTTSDNQSERKLANYLLGNFYLNTSNNGHFRHVLQGNSGNCCNSFYLPRTLYYSENEHFTTGAERVDQNEGYNLYSLGDLSTSYYGLEKIAKGYYQAVIANSTDSELNARTTFLIARCELHTAFNETGKYPDPEEESPYQQTFFTIEEEYKNTQFYQKLIKECPYFVHYTGL